MELDIDIDGWPSGPWPDIAARAIDAVAAEIAPLANERLTASLLFTIDDEIRDLNREWRTKDKPTNVLSFPMMTPAQLRDLAPQGGPEMLGDLAMAYETCAREAAEKAIPLDDHVAHLLVHGLLHLAGFDHETGNADAEEMEALEVKILARMGIADPYGAPHATARES